MNNYCINFRIKLIMPKKLIQYEKSNFTFNRDHTKKKLRKKGVTYICRYSIVHGHLSMTCMHD